jgi:tetratricopeptide (TPR) repeat protein
VFSAPWALLALLAAAGTTRAEGGSEADDARIAAEASKKGDTAALRALASRDDPDPWLVADALLEKGEDDAAKAFASSSSRAATKGLSEFVASPAARERDVEVRAALASLLASLASGDALPASAGAGKTVPKSPLLLARLRLAVGRALLDAKRLEESAAVSKAAAESAEAIGWDAGASQALEQAARALYRRGDWRGAREAAARWSEIEERLGSKAGTARATWLEGATHALTGEYDVVEASETKALALAKEAGDPECEANALGTLSFVAGARGDARKSLDLARQALARLDAAPPAPSAARFRRDDRLVRLTRSSLLGRVATLEDQAGRASEAAKALDAAQREAEEGRWPAQVATVLLARGALATKARDLLRALEACEQALAKAKEAEDRAGVAVARRRVGSARYELGDYPSALAAQRSALEDLTRIGDRREAVAARLDLGRTLEATGELVPAREAFEAARAEAETLGLKPLAAEARAHTARVTMKQGRYAEALAGYAAAIALRREVGPPAALAWVLSEAASLERRLGDEKKGEAMLLEARTIAAGARDPRTEGRVLLSLGDARVRAGDADAARPLLDEARARFAEARDDLGAAEATRVLAVLEVEGGAPRGVELARGAVAAADKAGDPIEATRARMILARALAGARREEEADAILVKALADAKESGELEGVAFVWLARAQLAANASRHADAAASAAKALEALGPLGTDLAEGEGASARSPFAGVVRLGMLGSLRAGDVPGAFRFLEEGRAATLLASLGGREAVRQAAVPEALRGEETTARAAEALAVARLREARASGERQAVRDARDALDAASARVADVVVRIQRAARAAAAAAYPKALPLDDARGLLAEGTALVAYETSSDEAFALVVEPSGARSVRLGPTDAVSAACAKVLVDGELPVDPAGVPALRALVVDPLELGSGVRRVLVCPDGVLSFVPFCLLVEGKDVAYAPSATVLSLLAKDASARGAEVLALGDPDYGTRGGSGGATRGGGETRGGALPPLPATRDEAKAVGDVVLLGAEASETGFARVVRTRERWRAVHLACHGIADAQGPGRAALALTADDANDGFLSATDVAGMRVAADLVVLSGCETAKGRLVGAEGVLGLPRAFLVAGAARVLASAWKVDDEATRALMTEFYRLWKPAKAAGGIGAATALRKAQEKVRSQKKWEHPYYWAAWGIWGLPE